MSPSRNQTSARAARPRPTTATPTTARGPKLGVIASLALHLGIVAAALITFQHTFDLPEESHPVPVDLITIAPKTNVAAQAPPAPEPPKVAAPVEKMTPPPLPQFTEAEPAPDVAPPKFKVEEPKESQQDFAALLNKLTAPDKTQKNAKPGPRVIQGIGAANAMTADIADALKSQIYRCWSPPVGAPNASDLVVDFDLRLNPDGSVGGVQLLTLNGNNYTRAAAEAASRAIYQCQPYRLPADRYAQWREINPLRFDPRQMMQQ